MSDLTVADELAYAALEEKTRELCDKIIAARIEEPAKEALDEAWSEGYEAGRMAELRKAEPPKPASTLGASHFATQPKRNGEAAD